MREFRNPASTRQELLMAKPKSVNRRVEVEVQSADIDALGHQELALSLIRHVQALPLGSVISVQGSWGRGKTDVVARAYKELEAQAKDRGAPAPLWLNPWQYGTPDLIRPVVLNLLSRLPPNQRGSTVLRRAAKTLLRAGNAMLFKALTVVAPFGDIIGAAEGSVDDFLKEFFDGDGTDDSTAVDADPVAAMAERFRELVDECLALQADKTGRLIVCVDDLDRCLPDHQIAMLEAIYFLTAARARCSFLVAMDPTLVQQAAVTHYKTAGFDSNQYMDKLFDLRINLAALQWESINTLIRSELSNTTLFDQNELEVASLLEEVYGVDVEKAVDVAGSLWLFLPELSNPRLIHRIIQRVQLLARGSLAAQDTRLRDPGKFRAVVTWCTIAERWPQLRQVLQAASAETWIGNLHLVAQWYGTEPMGERARKDFETRLQENQNFLARLPDKERHPDLGQFVFESVLQGRSLEEGAANPEVRQLADVDAVMLDLGL
jgi:hypothetical protein